MIEFSGELAALRAVIGDRRILVTEMGNHVSSYWSWSAWRKKIVREADRLPLGRWDVAWWRQQTGVDGVVWYQEYQGDLDGAATDPFGLRAPDWTWLPVGSVFSAAPG